MQHSWRVSLKQKMEEVDMLQFIPARTEDTVVLTAISKRAFDSGAEVGAPSAGGPPGYQSVSFYNRMAYGKDLYKLTDDGLIVGGAVLFRDGDKMNVGRIFVDPEHFRKGYGLFIMKEIEKQFSDVCLFALDTPLWNVRTNRFYQKLGYVEYRRDDEFAYRCRRSPQGRPSKARRQQRPWLRPLPRRPRNW